MATQGGTFKCAYLGWDNALIGMCPGEVKSR
jgi:hypothetical protein